MAQIAAQIEHQQLAFGEVLQDPLRQFAADTRQAVARSCVQSEAIRPGLFLAELLDLRTFGSELGQEFVIDIRTHQEPIARGADLSRVAEGPVHRAIDGPVGIGTSQDDERPGAARLQPVRPRVNLRHHHRQQGRGMARDHRLQKPRRRGLPRLRDLLYRVQNGVPPIACSISPSAPNFSQRRRPVGPRKWMSVARTQRG